MPNQDLRSLLMFYRESPCKVLPNAYWKTTEKVEHLCINIKQDSNGALEYLTLREQSSILSCWCKQPDENFLFHKDKEKLSFALIHDDCLKIFDDGSFSQRKPYFRLRHTGRPSSSLCPAGYHYETVNPREDLSRVTFFINQCYENIKLNKKIVQRWMNHPVYNPRLWIWIKDDQENQYAALGIAEIDYHVPEASLEWNQVNPEYQRRGLGSALVSELLRRVASDVKFTTVSGEVNNPSEPEKLYRNVGFSGSDVWWLLKA